MEKPENKTGTEKLGRAVIIVGAVCLVFAVMQGVHDNYGVMLSGIMEVTGLDYAAVSFVIGVGALVYGLAQPFMGMLALKKTNAFVMLLGVALIVVGLAVTPFCRNFVTLLIFFGLVLPVGTTGLASGILMGAITPLIGDKRAALVSGVVQASAGVGDALMAPAMERSITGFGITTTMLGLGVPFLIAIPIVLWVGALNRRRMLSVPQAEEDAEEAGLFAILKKAFRDRDYICILIGFGTCGFNMSIIESHLFSQYVSYGISGDVASLTLTVYGVLTMLGAIVTGALSTRFRMKSVLGTTYLIRVFISLGFLFLPKTVPFAFIMTALLGATGDSTVPTTMGTITRKFGAKKIGVLYGFALVGHQIGAFASASLGGLFVKNGLGYEPLWIVNMCLAALAAGASYAIHEEKHAR